MLKEHIVSINHCLKSNKYPNYMKIEKILIVPSERIIDSNHNDSSKLDIFRSVIKKLFKEEYLKYDGEFIFYADIPKILGNGNVYIYGQYYKHLLDANIPKYCPYPSCHGAPRATFINENYLVEMISSVDAVLISTRAGERGNYAKAEARKQDIPIALFDFSDHEKNYGSSNIAKNICYENILGKDYNIYFKKDLPLGYATEKILPIAPVPVRPESYTFRDLKKTHSIFYSGRGRESACQNDRKQSVEAIIEYGIEDTLFIDHNDRSSFMTTVEYWDNLSRSKFCLSPSGRVWDSFRNTEVGLSPNTVLIAPKPYVHTVGPELIDGVNSLLYDTELINGKYNLTNTKVFIEKIEYYLNDPTESKKIASNWSNDVKEGHTTFARSKHILKAISEIL